jgi:hypothetical protein
LTFHKCISAGAARMRSAMDCSKLRCIWSSMCCALATASRCHGLSLGCQRRRCMPGARSRGVCCRCGRRRS